MQVTRTTSGPFLMARPVLFSSVCCTPFHSQETCGKVPGAPTWVSTSARLPCLDEEFLLLHFSFPSAQSSWFVAFHFHMLSFSVGSPQRNHEERIVPAMGNTWFHSCSSSHL